MSEGINDPKQETDPTTPSDPPDSTANPTVMSAQEKACLRAKAHANVSKFRVKQVVKKLSIAAAGGLVAIGGTSLSVSQSSAGDLTSINSCGPEGTAVESQKIPWEGNPKKNRFTIPGDESLNGAATLDALLKENGTTTKFNQDESADIEGWITEVKMGGKESCNCGTNDPQFMDTHIYVGKTPNAEKKQCVIVEVTPRLRQIMAASGKDWSTENLIKTFSHQYVKISGWLFYDTEHENSAENTRPRAPRNWRASCWELHPVTAIDIIPAPTVVKK